MKRNDFATYIVYLGMIAIALLVGFLVVRPILGNWSSDYGLLTVILSVLGGAILNSVLLELGHLLGAKAGHYNVYGWTVLGLSFKKDANGKTKVGFSNFEGLTGETKMAPKDIEKATSSGVILLPLVLFLVEVVGGMVMIAFSDRMVNRDAMADAVWMKVVAVIVMAVGGMIFLYNYFPAHLDSVTDGYRMVLLSKPINKEAYNRHLLNEYCSTMGLPVPPIPTYDDVTDYTAAVNMDKVYQCLAAGKYGDISLYQPGDTEEESILKTLQALKESICSQKALSPQEYIDAMNPDILDETEIEDFALKSINEIRRIRPYDTYKTKWFEVKL